MPGLGIDWNFAAHIDQIEDRGESIIHEVGMRCTCNVEDVDAGMIEHGAHVLRKKTMFKCPTCGGEGFIYRQPRKITSLIASIGLDKNHTEDGWAYPGDCIMSPKPGYKVSAGDRAEIKFDLFPNKTFAGEVLSVSGTLDPRSATYSAEIVLKDIPNNVLSGLIGNVTIYPQQKQKACLLPVTAVSEAHGMNAFVFEINNENRAQKIAVKIAAILNDQVIVQSGLEDGMQIATEGAAYLMDGSLVQSKQ